MTSKLLQYFAQNGDMAEQFVASQYATLLTVKGGFQIMLLSGISNELKKYVNRSTYLEIMDAIRRDTGFAVRDGNRAEMKREASPLIPSTLPQRRAIESTLFGQDTPTRPRAKWTPPSEETFQKKINEPIGEKVAEMVGESPSLTLRQVISKHKDSMFLIMLAVVFTLTYKFDILPGLAATLAKPTMTYTSSALRKLHQEKTSKIEKTLILASVAAAMLVATISCAAGMDATEKARREFYDSSDSSMAIGVGALAKMVLGKSNEKLQSGVESFVYWTGGRPTQFANAILAPIRGLQGAYTATTAAVGNLADENSFSAWRWLVQQAHSIIQSVGGSFAVMTPLLTVLEASARYSANLSTFEKYVAYEGTLKGYNALQFGYFESSVQILLTAGLGLLQVKSGFALDWLTSAIRWTVVLPFTAAASFLNYIHDNAVPEVFKKLISTAGRSISKIGETLRAILDWRSHLTWIGNTAKYYANMLFMYWILNFAAAAIVYGIKKYLGYGQDVKQSKPRRQSQFHIFVSQEMKKYKTKPKSKEEQMRRMALCSKRASRKLKQQQK